MIYDWTRRPRAQIINHKSKIINSSGFSLLEVILALAILVGALAVLGELARLSLQNARLARDTTRATLLCESILNQIVAGVIPAEPVQEVPYECKFDERDPGWLYSVEVETLDQAGLNSVRVIVRQDLPPEQKPAKVSISRWINSGNL